MRLLGYAFIACLLLGTPNTLSAQDAAVSIYDFAFVSPSSQSTIYAPPTELATPSTNETDLTVTSRTLSSDLFKDDTFCWRETYGRGVGAVPTICPDGMENQAGLCYTRCDDGYTGVGPVCWGDCPEGFRDDGAFCFKPEAYGRGGGFIWQIGDQVGSAAGQFKRCEAANGEGNCEQVGAIVYPKCKEGFYAAGCCVCSPVCPEGFADAGISCTKPSKPRGVGVAPTICPTAEEYDAGLCYTLCRDGYVGVGPVCWEVNCPTIGGKAWVDCGAGCAQSSNSCATAIIDMVTTPLIAVLNIAGMIVTAGGSGAATAGVGGGAAAATAGVKTITATTNAGKVITYTTKAVSTAAAVSKQVIESDLLAKAQQQLGGEPMSAQQKKGIEEYAAMAYDASRSTSFDWRDFTSIDPTGLANVAAAYANPLCRDLKSTATETTSSVKQTAVPTNTNFTLVGDGLYRLQNNWYQNTYIHNQNRRLEIGEIQPNWWSAQWKVIPAGDGWVRIQNRWYPTHYIHIQNGQVEVGPIEDSWQTAQWRLEPAHSGWVRIKSRSNPDKFINNSPGELQAVQIQPNWASALWKFEE